MQTDEKHQQLPLPQGENMRNHVMEKTSARTGQLEDQSLDLDARAMMLLGKRQRLNVSSIHFTLFERPGSS